MPNNNREIILIALSRIYFLTLREKLILLKNLDTADSIALLSIKDIVQMVGRPPKTALWNGEALLHDAKASSVVLKARGIFYTSYEDGDYPVLLHEIPDAPFVLFYRGNLSVLKNRCVSIVGTRRLTPEGIKASYDFAYEAAKDGLTVVSGLASGADGKAHLGAVDAFYDDASTIGRTVAVLPCGIDTVVPTAHKNLAKKILETGGCLLSEYAPGVTSEPWRYVQRNRIIAGLSPATIVVQSPPGSGALLTADFALDYNRDLLFHESTFCPSARRVTEAVQRELEVKVARNEKSKSKLMQNPLYYIDEGAPIVRNYKDYKAFLAELPGTRAQARINIDKEKNCQLPLFSE